VAFRGRFASGPAWSILQRNVREPRMPIALVSGAQQGIGAAIAAAIAAALARMGQPAKLAAFLCSAWITGQVNHINGGMWMP
jgi:NAD(P)-dependent dehydrogenase (short-subunit alcohol dehydrogenase family)